MKGRGRDRVTAKDYLAAALRQMIAARGTDETTGAALERFALVLMKRAHDALLAERGGLEPALIA